MMNDSLAGYHALPAGFILNETYIIQEVLGEGGFGITYRGVHRQSGERVAIKEYFPSSFAVRTQQEGLFSLQPFPEKYEESFHKGRKRFVNEAQILKEFQHLTSIVSVYDLFEENGTAYIVMEYIEGLTLSQYIQNNGTFTFPEILHLMSPVIRSLAKIHERGLIHRDISPDNLILGTDNQLHLIDFGAASRENPGKNQTTVILKAGYAPPEQYIANGKMGAWIDVYALCATMYFALTGKAPSEAIHRLEQDSLEPLSQVSCLKPWQQAAIEKGLQIRPADRFQNMEELYSALMDTPGSNTDITVMGTPLPIKQHRKLRRLFFSGKKQGILLATGILCVVLSGMAGSIFLISQKENTRPSAVSSSLNVPEQMASPTLSPTLAATDTPSPLPATNTLLTMPDLTGRKVEKAKSILKKLDSSIKIKTTRTYSSTKAAGRVISQSIDKNTVFSKGSVPSLLLTVGLGKQPAATKKPVFKTPKPTATKKPSGKSDYKVREDDGYASIPLD